MAIVISKRQQARNEKALQELLKTPGNDRCADCGARNPGWASWSLGIFLCMRCAALHRKLGTHISKVKSLSMDTWSSDQVETMRKIGNTSSNKHYNPKNAKPSIPIDVDEVDGVMERFIRAKYEKKEYMEGATRQNLRHHTGSNSSVDSEEPPPLPPKPAKRFGFGLRAASSTFPLSRHERHERSPPISPGLGGFGSDRPSPPRVNKPSRIFGSTVNGSADSLDNKLNTLRDMGFTDEKRNSTVLKGLNGNLDKAVEQLIRLGEGASKTSSRSHTPVSAKPSNVNGLTIEKTRARTPQTSTNPFDAQPAPQQPTANPYANQLPDRRVFTESTALSNPYNPFNAQTPQSQQAQNMEQAFQAMQISQQQQQQQQPLFPNTTGGYGTQPQQPNPYQQPYTPPVPQIPEQYGQGQRQPSYGLTAPSPITPGGSNPFLRTSRSQIFTSSNPFMSQQPSQGYAFTQPQQQQPFQQYPQPTASPTNPFLQNQPLVASTPAQIQQDPFAQQQTYQQMQQQSVQTPQQQYYQPQGPAQAQFQVQSQFQQQPQHSYSQPAPSLYPQPTGAIRHDKSSILALYNYPQLAPPRPQDASADPALDPGNIAKRRSVTMPVPGPSASSGPSAGSLNPFASAAAPANSSNGVNGYAAQPNGMNGVGLAPGEGVGGAGQGMRHVSNESVSFSHEGWMGVQNGRHSPDAFASLSARY